MLVEHLQKTFAERSRKNPQYSLRSFARSLDIDSSTLSAILRGKRPLTAKTASKLIDALDLGDPAKSKDLLLATVSPGGQEKLSYDTLALEVAEAISSWEHFAILAFLEIDGIRPTSRTIARRLLLPLGIVLEATHRLELIGLVRKRGESWELTGKNMAMPAQVPNVALREALRQYMVKSLESLEKTPVHRREMSGITMAVSSAKLPEARRMIQEFRRSLSAFLENGPKDSVYRLNVELFPLTEENP